MHFALCVLHFVFCTFISNFEFRISNLFRDVAQFGRAPRSGRGGCGFKSRHLDQKQEIGVSLSLVFYLNEELKLQPLLFPNVFGTWGYEHDRIRWMIQGVFIGVAVKIVSDEQERPTILGTARGPLWVQIPSSRPY